MLLLNFLLKFGLWLAGIKVHHGLCLLAKVLWRLKQWLVSGQMTVPMPLSQARLHACVLRLLIVP